MEDLKYIQDSDKDALPNYVPLGDGENYSNDEGNEYVAEGGYNSNNDSSPPVHVYIPWYQVKTYCLSAQGIYYEKKKTSVLYKNILMKGF